MSLTQTPRGERLHIAILGKRNAGKSSLMNALCQQPAAIVSPVAGTTTDPVFKAMELLPLGPVMLIDTPGLDDEGELGAKRIAGSQKILEKTDIAILAVESTSPMSEFDIRLLQQVKERKLPVIIVLTKSDLLPSSELATEKALEVEQEFSVPTLLLSAHNKSEVNALREALGNLLPTEQKESFLIRDALKPGDVVVLVTPIDKAAPKGRLILPQQQIIRDVLEAGAMPIVARESELSQAFSALKQPPALVITDSQVFKEVADLTPAHIPLTSFSILFARYKGDLRLFMEGAKELDQLPSGARILIAEGCTHHRQCEDIGTVKLPTWIKNYTQKDFAYEFASGSGFPLPEANYDLIIHCGACMLSQREVQYRQKLAQEKNIPITNYGVIIAYMNGILPRVTAFFREDKNAQAKN